MPDARRLPILERSGIPLYIQVSGLVRKRLEAGEWRVGDQIPTIDMLMEQYGVSRVTMRQALTELEEQGLIERGQGRGTFVTGDATKERWLILPSEWDALIRHIAALDNEITEIEHGDRAPRLEPEMGMPAAAYWYARRVNRSGGVPYSLTDVYLAKDIYDKNPRAYSTKPVLVLLAQNARRGIRSALQILTIGTADMEIARYLELPVGAPVAEVRRVVHDADGRVIYRGDVWYPGRHLRVQTTLISHDPYSRRKDKK